MVEALRVQQGRIVRLLRAAGKQRIAGPAKVVAFVTTGPFD